MGKMMPGELGIDPFGGESLVLKKRIDGLEFSSIGLDRLDERRALIFSGFNRDDFPHRLWDESQRRKRSRPLEVD
jgi:hypothetical protein